MNMAQWQRKKKRIKVSSIFQKGKNVLKLFNLTDIQGFFSVVESCEGDVYITSPNGAKFNLKSNLTKYIAFSKILINAEAEQLELEVTNSKDAGKFIDFMMWSRGD